MKVTSWRFGELDVEESHVIAFPEGLVGLSQFKQFILLEDPSGDEFFWLQSVQESRFTLGVVRASKLGVDYSGKLSRDDLAPLDLESPEDLEILVILNRVDGAFTANLRGPIMLNVGKNVGRQAVVNHPDFGVRQPIGPAHELEPELAATN